MLGELAKGFQMGLNAALVIARKLEESWDRPLKAWRNELRLPEAIHAKCFHPHGNYRAIGCIKEKKSLNHLGR